MQKGRNYSVLAMELRIFSINPLRPSDAYMRQWSYHHWLR